MMRFPHLPQHVQAFLRRFVAEVIATGMHRNRAYAIIRAQLAPYYEMKEME